MYISTHLCGFGLKASHSATCGFVEALARSTSDSNVCCFVCGPGASEQVSGTLCLLLINIQLVFGEITFLINIHIMIINNTE